MLSTQDANGDDGVVPASVILIAVDQWRTLCALYGRQRVVRAGEIFVDGMTKALDPGLRRVVRRADLEWTLICSQPLIEVRHLAESLFGVGSVVIEVEGVECSLEPVFGVVDVADVAKQYGTAALTDETLMSCADAALARALESGSRWALYEAGALAAIRRSQDVARELARAPLGSFVPVYQSMVVVSSGEIVGFECLMRWKKGGRLVGPDEFITAAERSGMIVPIGWAVVEKAVGELAEQITPVHGPDSWLAINVSRAQLTDDRLVAKILAWTRSAEVDPSRVWIEIRENSVIQLNSPERRILEDLHSRGFRLCVDDLGAGYAALSYLRDLPIGAVKIDRSIVSAVVDSEVDRQMLRVIGAMAAEMGICSVAEGVETREVFEAVAELGIDYAQGYLFGAPLPIEEAVLATGRQ